MNWYDQLDGPTLMRIIPASLFIVRRLFIRSVEQFCTRPNEAKLKSKDIGQHQSRVKMLREEYKKYERPRRYQRQDYSEAYALRYVSGPYHRSPDHDVDAGSVADGFVGRSATR